ncbi:MAG: DNA internalization-related competence protein ComEC/Rec2 [Pseudobutyrivibrio sp.]|nr:DNA internalization-related competence protein ComEC/Rec2 [Pseudobutyrivibrio sp.]
MLGRRKIALFSLLFVIIIYIGTNFGLLGKTDEIWPPGSRIRVRGQIYSKEIKNDKSVYYLSCSNNTSLIFSMDSHEIPLFARVSVTGNIEYFQGPRNEGGFDAKAYYNSLGIVGKILNPKIESIEASPIIKKDIMYAMSNRMMDAYQKNLPGEEAGFLSSVTIGKKSLLDGQLKDLFNRVGVAHILAVSGLHVGFVCMGFYRFLRKKGRSFAISGALSSIVAIFYCIFTGGSISSMRAVGMFLIYILAQITGHKYDMLTGLALVADLLLIDNMSYINNASFRFSFWAILVIVFYARPLSGQMRQVLTNIRHDKIRIRGLDYGYNKNLFERIKEYIFTSLIFSLSVTVGMLPLVGQIFNQSPTVSIFVNLIILPLMPLLLALGLIGGIAYMIFPPIGHVLLLLCHYIIYFFELIADFFNSFPGANIITGRHSVFTIVLYYVLLSFIIYGLEDLLKGLSIKITFNKLFMTKTLLIIGLSFMILVPKRLDFEVDFLDVGQGDGIFISGGDGTNYFIDGGSTSNESLGKYTLMPFFKYKGISSIDYWFISHPDTDHVSGLIDMLNMGFEIDNIVISQRFKGLRNENLDIIYGLAEANKCKIIYMKRGDICGSKNIRFEAVFPGEKEIADDLNSLSLSLVMEYKNEGIFPWQEDERLRAFFGGDIGISQEEAIADSKSFHDIDLLKVSHHGSKFSSSEKFLKSGGFKLGVISVEDHSIYGHPAKETLGRLDEAAIPYLCTKDRGQIKIIMDKGTMEAKSIL